MLEHTFGPFTFDTQAPRLTRDGVEVRVRPRALQVLRVLLQHAGEWVGYEAMRVEAWEGVHVSPHTLDVTVAELRKCLGEYGRWLTHRHKFGYALQVPRSDEMVRKGWHFWSLRTRDGCERAIDCFKHAIVECPSDFRAFEGLSATYLTLAVFGMRPPLEMYPRFLEAHEQAVALSGLRPELRCNRAFGLCVFERRFAESEAEFLRALQEKPTLASNYVRLGMLYGSRGRFDDALSAIARAYEADPLLPTLPAAELLVRFWQRMYDEAVELGSRSITLHPYLQVMRVNYGQALEFSGRLDEALGQYQVASVISPDAPWLRAMEGVCQARMGRHRDARAILEGLMALRQSEYVDAYHLAVLRAAMGQIDEAFAELERAFRDNSAWLYTMAVDPKMDVLRPDPRFCRLLDAHAGPEGTGPHERPESTDPPRQRSRARRRGARGPGQDRRGDGESM